MSRCETCRSKGDCEEWCGLNASDLFDEIDSLKTQLDSAREVIEFYLTDQAYWEYQSEIDKQVRRPMSEVKKRARKWLNNNNHE